METCHWPSHHTVDPQGLQTRFSIEDGLAFMNSTSERVSEATARQIEKVRKILDILPAREADILELYYFNGLRQMHIANIFGCSQPTVSYRLQRATARILFLLRLPDIEEDEIRGTLSEVLEDDLDVEIMVLMTQTTCQSVVAKKLGESQGKVRHRFYRSLDKLKKSKRARKLVRLYQYIADNLTILREVRRFSQDDEVVYVVH